MIDVINSTELRKVGFEMRMIGSFPQEAGLNDPEAFLKWELNRDYEA